MALIILVSSCPSGAHERLALGIFVGARRLAHEHQVCLGIAGAKHDVAAVLGQLAALAIADLGAQGIETAPAMQHLALVVRGPAAVWVRCERLAPLVG
jgi:hypothetical protein